MYVVNTGFLSVTIPGHFQDNEGPAPLYFTGGCVVQLCGEFSCTKISKGEKKGEAIFKIRLKDIASVPHHTSLNLAHRHLEVGVGGRGLCIVNLNFTGPPSSLPFPSCRASLCPAHQKTSAMRRHSSHPYLNMSLQSPPTSPPSTVAWEESSHFAVHRERGIHAE